VLSKAKVKAHPDRRAERWMVGGALIAVALVLGAVVLIVRPREEREERHPVPPPAPVVAIAIAPTSSSSTARSAGAPKAPRGENRARAEALGQSAKAEIERGDLPAAEHDLQGCLSLAEIPECHRMLGELLTKRGERAKASVHLKRALEMAPDSPRAKEIRQLLEELSR
jgi:hypothetical protein